MEKLVDVAYSKFLLRDVLSYMLPGLMVLGCLAYRLRLLDRALELLRQERWPVLMLALSISYLGGLAMQAAGTYHSRSPTTWMLRFWPPQGPALPLTDADAASLRSLLSYAQEARSGEALISNVERFTVLQQMLGNMAMAFFLCAVILLAGVLLRFLRGGLMVPSHLARAIHGVLDLRDPRQEVLKLGVDTTECEPIPLHGQGQKDFSLWHLAQDIRKRLRECSPVPAGRPEVFVRTSDEGVDHRELFQVLSLFPPRHGYPMGRELAVGLVLVLMGGLFLQEHWKVMWQKKAFIETAMTLRAEEARARCATPRKR